MEILDEKREFILFFLSHPFCLLESEKNILR